MERWGRGGCGEEVGEEKTSKHTETPYIVKRLKDAEQQYRFRVI